MCPHHNLSIGLLHPSVHNAPLPFCYKVHFNSILANVLTYHWLFDCNLNRSLPLVGFATHIPPTSGSSMRSTSTLMQGESAQTRKISRFTFVNERMIRNTIEVETICYFSTWQLAQSDQPLPDPTL